MLTSKIWLHVTTSYVRRPDVQLEHPRLERETNDESRELKIYWWVTGPSAGPECSSEVPLTERSLFHVAHCLSTDRVSCNVTQAERPKRNNCVESFQYGLGNGCGITH